MIWLPFRQLWETDNSRAERLKDTFGMKEALKSQLLFQLTKFFLVKKTQLFTHLNPNNYEETTGCLLFQIHYRQTQIMRQWPSCLSVAALDVIAVMFGLSVVVFACLCSHAVCLWGYFVFLCGNFWSLWGNFASSSLKSRNNFPFLWIQAPWGRECLCFLCENWCGFCNRGDFMKDPLAYGNNNKYKWWIFGAEHQRCKIERRVWEKSAGTSYWELNY